MMFHYYIAWIWFVLLPLSQSVDIKLDQVKMLSEPYVEGLYNLSVFRVSKFNRTTFVLNVNLEYMIDFDESVYIENRAY